MRPFLMAIPLYLLGCGTAEAPPPPPGPTPSAARFTLECAPHGIRAYDAARSVLPGVPLACTAHVADRLGAPIEGVSVQFLTEAGRVRAQASSSPAGVAEALHEASEPLPADVTPGTFTYVPLDDDTHTGTLLAPLWMEPFHWVESPESLLTLPQQNRVYTLREPNRPDPVRKDATGAPLTNNPRDNLVTLIAVLTGEEAFTDTNGNGTWDVGEAFVDLTEPFVDADDDGTWTATELFLDVNENGVWDGKNGRWDHETKIWIQERVLWTGIPGAEDLLPVAPGIPGHRATWVVSPRIITMRCPPGSITCNQAGFPVPGHPDVYGPVEVATFLADPWFNSLARNGATDGCRNVVPEMPSVVHAVDLSLPLGAGARELWPAGEEITFRLSDVRDPTVAPGNQIPKRAPPFEFVRDLACDLTGAFGRSPETVTVPVRGNIE